MNYTNLTIADITTLQSNWNADMHDDFYLRDDVIQSQIILSQDLDLDCSFVAVKDNLVVGGIIVKTWKRNTLPKYHNTAWITLFHVQENYRNQGIGTTLLTMSKQVIQEKGYHTLHLGKDMNNLFCGVAEVFNSEEAFHKLGFEQHDTSFDMVRHVDGAKPIPLRHNTDCTIRLGTQADEPLAIDFFERAFLGRWTEEYLEYVRNGGTGKEFVFVFKDDKIVAFCRINHGRDSDNMYNTLFQASFQRLFGVGPLGVDPEYRGLSLGYDVTAYAINKAIELGASDIIIDWTSHVELYRKFGFDIWHTYPSFSITL